MKEWILELASNSYTAISSAIAALFVPACIFLGLALIIKRRRAFTDIKKAIPEIRITVLLIFFNTLVTVPFIVLLSSWIKSAYQQYGIGLVSLESWEVLGPIAVVLLAIFAGDFIGYWRHRLEHSLLFWPSHAVHHSDTEMSWLSLERFHPINRITTFLVDSSLLLLLGLPVYAVVANSLVRHYYGFFIHADIPWTYGRWGKVFVSPAMHRWHHASDSAAFNTNFATVFSVFDRWFGTFRVPGPCTAKLGVTDKMGSGVIGQLTYPFKPRAYRRLIRRFQNMKLRSLGRNTTPQA